MCHVTLARHPRKPMYHILLTLCGGNSAVMCRTFTTLDCRNVVQEPHVHESESGGEGSVRLRLVAASLLRAALGAAGSSALKWSPP